MKSGQTNLWMCAAVAGLATALSASALALQIDSYWIPGIFAAAVLVFPLIKRYPSALILPVVFSGEFKEVRGGLDRLNALDPTLLAVALLCGAVMLRLSWDLTRGDPSFLDAAASNWKGVILYLGLTTVISASFLYTPAPNYGAEKVVRFLGICSLLFFAPIVLIRRERDLRIFVVALVALSTALSVKTLYGLFHIKLILNGWDQLVTSVTEIGAGQLAGMAILAIVYYRFASPNVIRWLTILCVPLLVVGLAGANARGPILSLALVLLLGAIFMRRQQSLQSQFFVTVFILGLLLAGLVFLMNRTPGEAQDTMASKVDELSNLAAGHNPGGSAGKRLEFYDDAVRAFESRPAIGWGVGGWSQFYYHEDKRGYPHNLFLEVAVEQGLAGLFVLSVFVAHIFWVAARQRVELGGRFSFILPVVAYSLSVTMFSGDITDNRSFWMWCGLCLALSRLARVEERESALDEDWRALSAPLRSYSAIHPT